MYLVVLHGLQDPGYGSGASTVKGVLTIGRQEMPSVPAFLISMPISLEGRKFYTEGNDKIVLSHRFNWCPQNYFSV